MPEGGLTGMMSNVPYHLQPEPWPTMPPRESPAHLIAALIGAVGALAMIAGSLMPWAIVQTIFGTLSVYGVERDGVITLAAAVVVLVLAGAAGVAPRMWLCVVSLVAAALAAALAAFELVTVTVGLDGASSIYATAAPGIGLYVLMAGGVTATAAASYQVLQLRL